MLDVRNLTCGYGGLVALRDISLSLAAGECVCVIGPNGAGKSTLVHNIMGLYRPLSGEIRFGGDDIVGVSPEDISRRGAALVPEGRRIFGSLTVAENLQLGTTAARGSASKAQDRFDQVFGHFPILKERFREQAGRLSGGEQQMLAIARALLSKPRLLIIDEPSLGLAPLVTQNVYRVLAELKKTAEMAMLVVEQSAARISSIADRAYIFRNGRIVSTLSGTEVADKERIDAAYFEHPELTVQA